ncbi:MAG: hypothetical protein ABW022_18885, partial [Actinoplanes sp.]
MALRFRRIVIELPGGKQVLHVHEESGVKIEKRSSMGLHTTGLIWTIFERVEGPRQNVAEYQADPYVYVDSNKAGWSLSEAKQEAEPLIAEILERQRLIRATNYRLSKMLPPVEVTIHRASPTSVSVLSDGVVLGTAERQRGFIEYSGQKGGAHEGVSFVINSGGPDYSALVKLLAAGAVNG